MPWRLFCSVYAHGAAWSCPIWGMIRMRLAQRWASIRHIRRRCDQIGPPENAVCSNTLRASQASASVGSSKPRPHLHRHPCTKPLPHPRRQRPPVPRRHAAPHATPISKQSFFEKKDQKTFLSLLRDSNDKSFLLLFKKEGLALTSTSQPQSGLPLNPARARRTSDHLKTWIGRSAATSRISRYSRLPSRALNPASSPRSNLPLARTRAPAYPASQYKQEAPPMDTDTILARAALRLDAREIPIPAHLSPAARTFLAAASMQPGVPEPAGSTQAEWDAAAAAWDERILPGMEAILAQIPITLETLTIGDCQIHVATPPNLPPHAARYAFLDIHGGGLVFGAGRFAPRHGGIPRGLPRLPRVLGRLPLAAGAPLSRAARRLPGRLPPPAGSPRPRRYRGQRPVRRRQPGRRHAAARPRPGAAHARRGPADDAGAGPDGIRRHLPHQRHDRRSPCQPRLPRANALYAHGADLAHPYISPLFGDFGAGISALLPAIRHAGFVPVQYRGACIAPCCAPANMPNCTSGKPCPMQASAAPRPRMSKCRPPCANSWCAAPDGRCDQPHRGHPGHRQRSAVGPHPGRQYPLPRTAPGRYGNPGARSPHHSGRGRHYHPHRGGIARGV